MRMVSDLGFVVPQYSMETTVSRALLAFDDQVSEVEQLVRDALAQSPIQSHRKIRVEQAGNILFLHGSVESFYYKQLAQEVVRNICRGVRLANELDVDYASADRRVEL